MLRFGMSTVAGEPLSFAFDERPELLAADEADALAEAAQLGTDDDISDAFELLADAMERRRLTRTGLRVLVAVAWIAHRRAGTEIGSAAFARLVAPATLRWLPDEDVPAAVGDAGPRPPSATRSRPKGRKKNR